MSIASGQGNKELETDWQQSEFVTDSLNWHNIYRQRHGAPPLTLCPQVSNREVVSFETSLLCFLMLLQNN
jgi:hypothetical protein